MGFQGEVWQTFLNTKTASYLCPILGKSQNLLKAAYGLVKIQIVVIYVKSPQTLESNAL